VRLREIQAAYGERVRVQWRAFPLIPDRQPGRRTTEKTRQGRIKVGGEEPRARFSVPELDLELPSSSVPGLTAAKCAERQGEDAFARFHERLFVAHFGENQNIGRHDVLCALAAESGLDVDRFRADYGDPEVYQAVLQDYAEGAGWFGVSALPTVIFDEKLSLVGAVPADSYRSMIDWTLAGKPGGVISLAPGEVAMPGRSAVGSPEATS
jgi:predicted DsbA family dithiol-disulfide isomerase